MQTVKIFIVFVSCTGALKSSNANTSLPLTLKIIAGLIPVRKQLNEELLQVAIERQREG